MNCKVVTVDLGSRNISRLFSANLCLTWSSSAMHFTFSCPFCKELRYDYYYYPCYPQYASNLQNPATTTPESFIFQHSIPMRARSRDFPLSCLHSVFIWSCCTAPTDQKAARVGKVSLISVWHWDSLGNGEDFLSFSVSQPVPKSLIIYTHTSTQNLTGMEADCTSAGNRQFFSKMQS